MRIRIHICINACIYVYAHICKCAVDRGGGPRLGYDGILQQSWCTFVGVPPHAGQSWQCPFVHWPQVYFRDGWNSFDFFVVMLTNVLYILEACSGAFCLWRALGVEG